MTLPRQLQGNINQLHLEVAALFFLNLLFILVIYMSAVAIFQDIPAQIKFEILNLSSITLIKKHIYSECTVKLTIPFKQRIFIKKYIFLESHE